MDRTRRFGAASITVSLRPPGHASPTRVGLRWWLTHRRTVDRAGDPATQWCRGGARYRPTIGVHDGTTCANIPLDPTRRSATVTSASRLSGPLGLNSNSDLSP